MLPLTSWEPSVGVSGLRSTPTVIISFSCEEFSRFSANVVVQTQVSPTWKKNSSFRQRNFPSLHWAHFSLCHSLALWNAWDSSLAGDTSDWLHCHFSTSSTSPLTLGEKGAVKPLVRKPVSACVLPSVFRQCLIPDFSVAVLAGIRFPQTTFTLLSSSQIWAQQRCHTSCSTQFCPSKTYRHRAGGDSAGWEILSSWWRRAATAEPLSSSPVPQFLSNLQVPLRALAHRSPLLQAAQWTSLSYSQDGRTWEEMPAAAHSHAGHLFGFYVCIIPDLVKAAAWPSRSSTSVHSVPGWERVWHDLDEPKIISALGRADRICIRRLQASQHLS